MEALFPLLQDTLARMWWPFCRAMALLSAAPILGEMSVPVTVRVLLSLVLAVVMLPMSVPPEGLSLMSLQAIGVTVEQAVIGGVIGLAFHLVMSAVLVLGFIVSSQMGLSMAVMNDPLNGTSSDVVSSLLSILVILTFFSMDGHLVLVGVLAASFHAWPVGGGLDMLSLQTLAFNVAWVFSAAVLLAVPVVFATMAVQIGFGFLARVAPGLNVFALGFSVITIFGLFMLAQVLSFIPDHYVRMMNQVLEMLARMMRAAGHG
ncbi:MAG: flagellar biosynthetic protein FliR [Aquabacterium sp.]